MQIGNRQFKPDPIVSLAYLVVLAALLGLGTWQWNRADQKQQTIDSAANATEQAAVSLHEFSTEELAGSPVQITVAGRWQPQWQFLWDNRVYKGQAGFEVISVLISDNGQALLVNRGWVPPGQSRSKLPVVALGAAVAKQELTLQGLLTTPSKGLVGGSAIHDQTRWPMLLQYFDYELIGQVIAQQVTPAVLQLSAESQHRLGEQMYISNWQPVAGLPPIRHIGYSVQWYAMALMLTMLFVFYNVKKIED
ncbi:MAG: SURF1 family protein [Granulosicoccaceae bacterium]